MMRFMPGSARGGAALARLLVAWALVLCTTALGSHAQQPPPAGAPVRVGGDVQTPARTRYVPPSYPPAARAAGIQGVVVLEATIDRDGHVTDVRMLRSPDSGLTQAAIDAVRRWEYEPTIVGGQARPVVMTVTVSFSLGGQPAPAARPAAPTAPVSPSPAAGAGPVTVVGLTGDGARVVQASRLGYETWDLADKTLVRRAVISPAYYPQHRALSPDGRWLALHNTLAPGAVERTGVIVGSRYETHWIDVETGERRVLDPVAEGTLGGAAFSADGRAYLRLVSEPEQTTFHVWRVPTGELLSSGSIAEGEVGPILAALSPAGDRFAMATHFRSVDDPFPPVPYGRIRVVASMTGEVLTTVRVPGIPRAMQFSGDGGSLLWSNSADALVHVSDVETGEERASLTDSAATPSPERTYGRGSAPGAAEFMALAPGDFRLVAGGRTGGGVVLWDLRTGTREGSLVVDATPWAVATDARGRLAAVGTATGLEVFDLTDAEAPVRVFDTGPPAVGLGPGTGRARGAGRAGLATPTPIPYGQWGAGAYRPGPGVTSPRSVASVSPTYTDAAREARLQGTVTLEAVVRPDGTVADVRVVRSLDTELGLDDAAVEAARQWVFEPGQVAGQPVAVIVVFEMAFRVR